MLYGLVDGGRLIATCDAPRGSHGRIVEYGGERDGVATVDGRARLTRLSALSVTDRFAADHEHVPLVRAHIE